MKAPTWLLLLLAVLIVGNFYVVAGSLQDVADIVAFPFAAAGRVILALVWIVVLVAALFGLLREKPIAFTWIAPLLTLYGVVGLIWNALFSQSSYSRGTQGFDVLLTLIVLAPVWYIALRRKPPSLN